MRHTHLGQPVRFPKGAHPGDRIEYVAEARCRLCNEPTTEDPRRHKSDGHRGHASYFSPRGDNPYKHDAEPIMAGAVVLDRAANGVGDGCELPGYWLWVQRDDGSTIRVRYVASGPRAGMAYPDDGPQWVRSGLGNDEVWSDGHRYPAHDWRMAKRAGRCLCCAQEARTG